MDLKDFATERYPLRCSRLPMLMACPWKIVMEFLQLHQRDGGSAAQTGSAAHKAIHVYHSKGKEVEKAVTAMKAARQEFPLADFAEAERLFRAYVNDPRNTAAQVVQAEFLLHGEIEKGIVLEGTADQLREEETRQTIWDVKTSRFAGPLIRDQHTYQVAAYAYLAAKRFGAPVHPGGIIMLRGYEKSADKAYYPYDLTHDDAVLLMQAVADRVREIRAGRIHAIPGDHCGYCIGTRACMTKLAALSV